jgi:hypothetical protein
MTDLVRHSNVESGGVDVWTENADMKDWTQNDEMSTHPARHLQVYVPNAPDLGGQQQARTANPDDSHCTLS